MKHRMVSIEDHQDSWLREHHVNLSSLVRHAIDNYMKAFIETGMESLISIEDIESIDIEDMDIEEIDAEVEEADADKN